MSLDACGELGEDLERDGGGVAVHLGGGHGFLGRDEGRVLEPWLLLAGLAVQAAVCLEDLHEMGGH